MDNSSIPSTCLVPFSITLIDIIFICEALFTILTFILYFFQCSFFIGKLKKGFSSFAVLFILTASMNFVQFIGDLPARFLILGKFCPFLEEHLLASGFWLTPTYFLYYYSVHADFYIATVTAVNRLSVFYFPLTYERFFRRNIIRIVIVLLIIPLASSGYLSISPTKIRRNIGGYGQDYSKVIPIWSSNSRNSATVVFLTVPLIAISSILTLHKYRTTRTAERKDTVFMVVSILQCIILSIFGGIQILFYYIPNGPSFWTVYTNRLYVSDICVTLPAWTLFIMGSEIRKHIQSVFCGRNSAQSVEIVTVQSLFSSR